MGQDEDADCHFAASGIAAIVNFPLWRASAIAQSGFKIEGSNVFVRYYKAVMRPPYHGVLATMLGMTWARGAIFYFSDAGKALLLKNNVDYSIATAVPPMVIGTLVQIINMPIVRGTITIQDPNCKMTSVTQACVHIYKTRGIAGLWHGVSAGILKTVPKYVTAVAVKDYMEAHLPQVDHHDKNAVLLRAAVKSIAAGVAGAALTNPLDVLRNEMFKTDMGLVPVFKKCLKEEGWGFTLRGLAPNVTAVAIPIAITIFATDMLKAIKHGDFKKSVAT